MCYLLHGYRYLSLVVMFNTSMYTANNQKQSCVPNQLFVVNKMCDG